MESRFQGVPISATLKAPEAASSYRGITIRAPLTVDESEFEYSFSSKTQGNSTTSSYYSGSESEGYESGEVELEKDEGVLEKTHFVEEFAVSEPSLRSPDEEFGQESVGVSKNDVFRPFVRIPDGKMYRGSSVVDDSDDSGSFLSDSGDELVKDEIFVANLDDSRPLVAVIDEAIAIAPVVDVGIPLVQKLHIPIAQISADSDDDSQISGVSDEEGFSGIVRVPSIEILRRIDSIPKVKVLESEGDDEGLRAEKIVEQEFVDDLVVSDADLGSLDDMENLDATSSVNCSVSADFVLDKGLDIDGDDTTNSLVVDENEEFDSTLESGKNEDLLHLGFEIQESEAKDEGNRSEKDEREVKDEKFDSTFESGNNGDNLHLGLEIQESDVINEGNNRSEKMESGNEDEIVTSIESFSSIAAQEIGSVHQRVDIIDVPNEACPGFPQPFTESMMVEDTDSLLVADEGFNSTLESGKNGDLLHLGLDIQENEGNRSEKKESENTHKIVTTVESFSSVHHCVQIMELPTERPVFPEPLTESMTVYMSNSLFEDTSLSSAIDAGESVSESSESGHTNRKEALKCDEEISSNRLEEIDGQIAADSHVEMNADGLKSDHGRVVDPANFEAVRRDMLDEGIVELSPIDGSVDLVSFLLTSGELDEASSETKTNKIEQIRVNLDSTTINLAAQKMFDLDFSLSILVIGKTGVGKSATINSIFGETKVVVDPFEPGTPRVKEIVGTINGIKLKVFDTPGLRTWMDQSINRKVLSSIKKVMQKSPPDVILYVDRLDTGTSLHDLKSITTYLGSSIWRKSIIVFTHGASFPPDGPHTCPLRYKELVAEKSRAVRQIISHSMVPVCVVENLPFMERNGDGDTLLLNGERWRSEFLLLCCSMKILSEFKNVPPNPSSGVVDEETGAPEMRVPPSFKRGSWLLKEPVLGWDRTGIADHFPAVITVQFSKNVAAAFNEDRICVRTRCLDHRVASLALVPIVRAVFKKMFGHD